MLLTYAYWDGTSPKYLSSLGQWVPEFATQVSVAVEIRGIDIASRFFPPTYPANIHLSIQSITRSLLETSGRIPQVGPCPIKLESMKYTLYVHLLVNHKKQLLGLLLDAGFVGIKCIDHPVPIGESAGESGREARTNFTDVVSIFKTLMLNAGGFGIVATEDEFDQNVMKMKEWKQSDGVVEVFIFCAQKPFVDPK